MNTTFSVEYGQRNDNKTPLVKDWPVIVCVCVCADNRSYWVHLRCLFYWWKHIERKTKATVSQHTTLTVWRFSACTIRVHTSTYILGSLCIMESGSVEVNSTEGALWLYEFSTCIHQIYIHRCATWTTITGYDSTDRGVVQRVRGVVYSVPWLWI